MVKNSNKTELGTIRTLANSEEYTRKAEKELSSNMAMLLSEEEYNKVFLESGKAIVTAKEEIQEIKEKKGQELVAKYKATVPTDIGEFENNKIFDKLEDKARVVKYWFDIIRTSETSCRIIDKYTRVPLLETDIAVADKIIKATFEEKQQADEDWEKIERITKNSPNCWAEVTRLDTDFCRIQIKGTPNAYEVNLKGALEIIQDMFGMDI